MYAADPLAPVNIENGDQVTPLHMAVFSGDLDSVINFIDRGADVNARTSKGVLPLEYAKKLKIQEIEEYLLKNGADTNLDGNNALHTSVLARDLKDVESILSGGLDVNQSNSKGMPPLLLALKNNDYPMAEFLISRGAQVNVAVSNYTLLSRALLDPEIKDKKSVVAFL